MARAALRKRPSCGGPSDAATQSRSFCRWTERGRREARDGNQARRKVPACPGIGTHRWLVNGGPSPAFDQQGLASRPRRTRVSTGPARARRCLQTHGAVCAARPTGCGRSHRLHCPAAPARNHWRTAAAFKLWCRVPGRPSLGQGAF